MNGFPFAPSNAPPTCSPVFSVPCPDLLDATRLPHARTFFSSERRRLRGSSLPCRGDGRARLGSASLLPEGEGSRSRPRPFQSPPAPIHAMGNGPLHEIAEREIS